MMNGREKSHSAIVAAKPANDASASNPDAAELVEPRAETKRNANEQSTLRTLSRGRVSQALGCVRQSVTSL
jgi:RNA-directed DNA polymerase